MEKDKKKLFIIFLVTLLLLVSIVTYAYFANASKDINRGDVIVLALPLIIVLVMLGFALNRFRGLKKGMPLEDERSKKVMMMAAARAFYISIYWILAISIFEDLFADLFRLDRLYADEFAGGAIMGMAIIFLLSWAYANQKEV